MSVEGKSKNKSVFPNIVTLTCITSNEKCLHSITVKVERKEKVDAAGSKLQTLFHNFTIL